MRLSGFLELPRLAKESPSPTWQARGGRWVGFSGLSSSISFTIGTSPMGSATCVEQRGREPQVTREQRQLSPGGATQTASVSALSPLRGLRAHSPIFLGLTPQANHYRRSAAKICRYQCPASGSGTNRAKHRGHVVLGISEKS